MQHGPSEHQNGPELRDSDTRGIRRIRDAADRPVQAAREIIEKGAGAVAQTADTRHAANQGEEVARSGLRTFAEAQPLANASYADDRRVVDTEVPLLVGYYTQLGRGFLQMQQSYFDVLRRSMGVAGVQRNCYRNAVTTTIEASRAQERVAMEAICSGMRISLFHASQHASTMACATLTPSLRPPTGR